MTKDKTDADEMIAEMDIEMLNRIRESQKGKIISGVKIEDRVISETGSSRSDQTGKGRYDLIPPCALRRLSLRFEGGAACHGERDWEKGMSVSRCYCSAFRHLMQWASGFSDEDHLAAVMWNISAIMFMEENKPEHLDMPFSIKQKKEILSNK